jgi:hypothetical protein
MLPSAASTVIEGVSGSIKSVMDRFEAEVKPAEPVPDIELQRIFELYARRAPKASVNQSFDTIISQVTSWNLTLFLRFVKDFKLLTSKRPNLIGLSPEIYRKAYNRLALKQVDYTHFVTLIYEISKMYYGA